MRIDTAKSRQGGGTILGLFLGLVIGVVAAAGVVWYMNKTPIPIKLKGQPNASEPLAVPVEPEPLPGKPGDKVAEKPRFEFYKILPGAEEAVPQGTPAAASDSVPAAATPAAQTPAAEPLFLQAGAFQNASDADNLKARLALMGVEASVTVAEVADKGTVHRVRIGPYANPATLAQTRALLTENGIPASVVRP